MSDGTHHTRSSSRSSHPFGALGLDQLPRAAADLVLLGDLTGRYAAGSYSRLDTDGRALVLREDRTGAAEHGHRITAAIACHVARAGGTVHELTQLLLHPDHEGGRHARTIALRSGQARASNYIQRVWASARATVTDAVAVESRHHADAGLAAIRDLAETTPWPGERGRTAFRVLRAHLNFTEAAGGRRHAASERQAAEEAGISRQTLRNAYEAVLKPAGWLQRLRVGRGTEGSTWYLGTGPERSTHPRLSRSQTTQFPPDRELGEWSPPETRTTANVDSTVIGQLMGHDAFAHHGLGSSALMIISSLSVRAHQSISELIHTASVSRATAYRTLKRLVTHGLARQIGETWALTPRALEGIGTPPPEAVIAPAVVRTRGWNDVARQFKTLGVAASRKALHAAERAAYLAVLEKLSTHRKQAMVIVRDGRRILVPAPRADEIPATWHGPGGRVIDPASGRIDPGLRVATDGHLILITPADQLSYDDLVAAHQQALHEWESAA